MYIITLVDKKSDLVQLIVYVIGVSESGKNNESNPRRAVCEKPVFLKIKKYTLTILLITSVF